MVRKSRKMRRIPLSLVIILICGLIAAVNFTGAVQAGGLPSEGPERKANIMVSYTLYEWWLLSWHNSQVVCQIYVEHEGWPDASEVQYYCGDQVMNEWLKTQPCVFSNQVTEASQCTGLYLHLASVSPSKREIEVNLTPPEVWVSISDCDPVQPENQCGSLPSLHLQGEEPLPNESIISIQGYMDGKPFNCAGTVCDLPLPPTGPNGIKVEFWAESSFGDSSEIFEAQVRVIPWGDFTSPEEVTKDSPLYYVDVLSSQWRGQSISTCSQIWSSFSPVGGPPAWLTSPEHPQGLISTEPYYYLAGSFIKQGMVDVRECDNGGLETPGIANQCGLECARPLVNDWQNQFNSEILRVADETGVPAQLMKNIFSRESQFWPGIYENVHEAGLGHLSDMGADTVLLWNPSFFTQFCPLVLETSTCQRGFGNLDLAEQEMLRGALVQKVNAACPDCPMGIDLAQANFSISIFARSLLANCEQVGQIIYNSTQRVAGEIVQYEDLWRFTLVNYNAGPGCLTNALQQTISLGELLDWSNVSSHLEPACQPAADYVNDISDMP